MKPYFQTTPFTTAASSLLIILNHLKPEFELNKENEFEIWIKTAILPTRASSIFALADYAKRLGLSPKVMVEKEGYDFPDYRFYRYTKEDIDNAAYCAKMHLEKAKNNNVNIIIGDITLNDVKNELENKKLILLRINSKPIRNEKRNTSNYIVVKSYKNQCFDIVDPHFGAFSIPEELMEQAFLTLETKKYRDHRMIIF